MTKHEIKVSFNTAECELFIEWLNEQWHIAEMCDSTGDYIDGAWTSTDESADEIMRHLWAEYCNS